MQSSKICMAPTGLTQDPLHGLRGSPEAHQSTHIAFFERYVVEGVQMCGEPFTKTWWQIKQEVAIEIESCIGFLPGGEGETGSAGDPICAAYL